MDPELAEALELAARSAVGLVLADPNARNVFANQASLELLGRSLEDLLAPRSLEDWVPARSLPKVRAQLAARIRGEAEPYRTRVRMSSGRSIDVYVRPTPLFSREGAFLGSLALVTRGGDAALRSSESLRQRYRNAFPAPPRATHAPQRMPAANAQAAWLELSRREREVARILLQGRRPADIATALGLSVHTVRSHLRLIYRKLGVHSQVELAAQLLERAQRPA